jgi:tetraacyldisaccharide 4'-kinase
VKGVLFVSNGHGEAAIADRIAEELAAIAPQLQLDHLALVGEPSSAAMRDVGPVRTMPSGGLVAMGNVGNIVRDVGAGLLGLTIRQRRFLAGVRGRYGVVAAIGDTYAFVMARAAGVPTVFVGTAKSAAVAPYGPLEAKMLRSAAACFVRDAATARQLAGRGVAADAANVIADLGAAGGVARRPLPEGASPAVVLLPGSREDAYGNTRLLLRIALELARERPAFGAAVSVAPGIDAERMLAAAPAGWAPGTGPDPEIPWTLELDGRVCVRAWSGGLTAMFSGADLVLGQAGTANEAAAAAGVPVIALERPRRGRAAWYRRRQQGLLGEALLVLPASPDAVREIARLLDDPGRRRRMSEAGRAAMGPPGGALRIAGRLAQLAQSD